MEETKRRDAKALFITQQVIHEKKFSRISAATASPEAWKILPKEFKCDGRVLVVKLQSLRRDFKSLNMKTDESINDFFYQEL